MILQSGNWYPIYLDLSIITIYNNYEPIYTLELGLLFLEIWNICKCVNDGCMATNSAKA